MAKPDKDQIPITNSKGQIVWTKIKGQTLPLPTNKPENTSNNKHLEETPKETPNIKHNSTPFLTPHTKKVINSDKTES